MAAALGVPRRRADSTLDSHLTRWGGMGRVRQLRRGLYLRVDGVNDGGRSTVDVYSVAAGLASDAVLSYHTALELHGLAQSAFQRLFVGTASRVRELRFEGMDLVPVRPRAGYSADAFVGTVVMERPDGEVRATTVERTVLDVLDRPELAGGVEEVWRSLDAVPALDYEVLRSLLQRVVRPVLAARLGFLLEVMRKRCLVPEKLLNELERSRPRGPVYLDRRRRGRLQPRWNLVVPRDLVPGNSEPADEDQV